MRKMLALALAVAAVASLAVTTAAPAKESRQTVTRAAVVTISTRKIPRLGVVLVNSKGLTLYMFVPDKRAKVTCLGTCAAVWPPVKLPTGAKAVAAGAAHASLLGSDRNPAGGRVITYNKWPLYTYVADRSPGQTKGQALNLNGGFWYVLSPSGKLIKTKLAGSSYP